MLVYVAISSPVGKSDHMVLDFRLIMPGSNHNVSEMKRFAFLKGKLSACDMYVLLFLPTFYRLFTNFGRSNLLPKKVPSPENK